MLNLKDWDRLLERVKLKLLFLNIRIIKDAEESDFQLMSGSVTNQFLKVQDNIGNLYLVRINGELWFPFTRIEEDYNLFELRRNKIFNNVVYNNRNDGFQICELLDTNYANQPEGSDAFPLPKIASSINKLHTSRCNFRSAFPLQYMVESAYHKLSRTKQLQLYNVYQIILRVIFLLSTDRENYVPSHNDLLPSSIYDKEGQVVFVDWEYSGRNHRTYDLAFFAIQTSLDAAQENTLLSQYDKKSEIDDLPYLFSLIKPVISFVFLTWVSISNKNLSMAPLLVNRVEIHIQDAYFRQSFRRLHTAGRLGLFSSKERTPVRSKQNEMSMRRPRLIG